MRNLAAVLALLAAVPVLATSTWSYVTGTPRYIRAARADNPTAEGVEPAPTLATDGIDLSGLTDVVVVATTAGGNMAVSSFAAYYYNPKAAVWARMPALDLTTIASPSQAWRVTVPIDYGRLAWEPVALTTPTSLQAFGAVKSIPR